MKTVLVIGACLVWAGNLSAQSDPSRTPASRTTTEGESSTVTPAASPSVVRLRPTPTDFVSGPKGDLFMDGRSPYSTYGVQLGAHADAPNIFARLGNADSSASFSVVDVNNVELMRVSGNGQIRIGNATTTSPFPKFDIETGSSERFAVWSAKDGFGFYGPLLDAIDDSGNLLPMVYNATKHIFWTGYVGIGTPDPHSSLHVFSNTTGANWGGRGVFSGATKAVVAGQYNDVAVIAAHNAALNAYEDLYINWDSGGGNVLFKGKVGIGMNNPSVALDVNGSIRASGVIGAVFQDVAEWVPASGDVPPGTVVILNSDKNNEVMPSADAYDTRVAGVVSARPGLLLGEAGASKAKIATTGRVKVRVDATKHAIHVGDLLVTSDTSGATMVSQPLDLGGVKIHRPGTLIGKALEPLSTGQGEILVLLSLQ